MYEIEVKLPLRKGDMVEQGLKELGFEQRFVIREEDHYFDREDGRIRLGGEALRVRSITNLHTGKTASLITYKGKVMDGPGKSRRELETEVADGNTAAQILNALGFYEVSPAVIKQREEYQSGRMHACVDHVEKLGDFLELEIVAERKAERESALGEIEKVLVSLGYTMGDTIRNSYLGLLQKQNYE